MLEDVAMTWRTGEGELAVYVDADEPHGETRRPQITPRHLTARN